LRRWERMEPVQMVFTLTHPDMRGQLNTPFLLKRGTGYVRVRSNPANTLVVASTEMLPETLPEVHTGAGVPPYFSALLDENESWLPLPEDTYSFKCWSVNNKPIIPAGGTNRIVMA